MTRLRRSDPTGVGYTRRRAGTGFSYLDQRGVRIAGSAEVQRIQGLAIPPAWTDVWICPHANGHIRVLGTDDAGRRQYLYHPAWHAARSSGKFARARELGDALPALRRRLVRGLDGSGLTEDRVLACAVRLLDLGLFRIGSEQYAETNNSYGLATVRRDHVTVTSGGVLFEYPAKSGQRGEVLVTDPRVRDVVQKLLQRRDPAPELLAWWNPSSRSWIDVKSSHINDRVKDLTGLPLTAKDFRTWHASVLMATYLGVHARRGETLTRKRLAQAFREVSLDLGNTPSVVRTSYVDPRVIDLAERGLTIAEARSRRHELVSTAASNALSRLLDRHEED